MQLRLPIDRIHFANRLPCLYLVPHPYSRRLELAIKREIISMLHKDALVISRHDDNLLDHTVKDSLDRGIFLQGYGHSVIER